MEAAEVFVAQDGVLEGLVEGGADVDVAIGERSRRARCQVGRPVVPGAVGRAPFVPMLDPLWLRSTKLARMGKLVLGRLSVSLSSFVTRLP